MRCKNLCTNAELYSSIVLEAEDLFFFIKKMTQNTTKTFVHQTEYNPSRHITRSFLLTPSIIPCNIFRLSSFDFCLILRANMFNFFDSQLSSYTFRSSRVQAVSIG